MAPRKRKEPQYYPLGFFSGSAEIADGFSYEAELIGTITILWNRHELHLRSLFDRVLGAASQNYAEAIWDRQPTHQAKRNLLALALDHADLTKKQRMLLELVLDRTKTLADRRNALIHAEYVISPNEQLLAKITSPNSKKGPRYQKNTPKDLQRAIDDLEELDSFTGALTVEFLPPDLLASVQSVADRLRAEGKIRPPQNRQTDSPPPSGRRKRAPKLPPPPEPEQG